MDIQNRRYTGSKYKLIPWIKDTILEQCEKHDSFFDVFGGTGIVTASMLDVCSTVYINDFLYSNQVIYKAFFSQDKYRKNILKKYEILFKGLDDSTEDNYVSHNFGDKYFSFVDAKKIGFIREKIEKDYLEKKINSKEYSILLASLLYSLDRAANTVGHYEAYIKKEVPRSSFEYNLITPIHTESKIKIFREDSNKLAPKIKADIAFVDPPYNSRQYSRFYHVLETITKWEKPELKGVALKPPEENMSEYCRSSAPRVFDDLIKKLRVKYIAVTYNNTYNSKSSSSANKITLEQIKETLDHVGKTNVYEHEYQRFNAGKTDKVDHKEYLFITSVNNNE